MTNRVLLLGGRGYIGSALSVSLANRYEISVVDGGWYDSGPKTDYFSLTADYLQQFDTIVLLAGHSSVKSCEGEIAGPWLNNVTNFSNLLSKLNSDQLVIYASSASVYGNSRPGTSHAETNINFVPVTNYDITKYSLDMWAKLNFSQHKIIGLRFGTVNGCSPVLRTDVMINSMYDSAIWGHNILVSNKHIERAILGINDLSRAIACCIDNPVPGIYNLASFNDTVENIANNVGRILNVPVRDVGTTKNAYDFSLDCSLFSNTYDFTFEDTPNTIIETLRNGYDKAVKQRRDHYVPYNRK